MKSFLKQISRHFKDSDKVLLWLCIFASSLSIIFLFIIHSTFPDMYGKRIVIMQIFASIFGILLIIAISFFDYKTMTKLWFVHMPLCILLMLATFIWGVGRSGADDKAWLYIFGVSVQPAEFLKLSFILTFAAHLEATEDKLNSFKNIVLLCLHAIVPIGLVVLQGDDGTALIFMFIFATMMFASGVAYKYFIIGAVGIITMIPVAWNYILSNDQKLRFLVLIDDSYSPAVIYQQNAALKAIGSGGVWGNLIKGGKISYVPEMQNDMIFSFIGNLLGFVGCIGILVLLTFICVRILNTGKDSNDLSGKVISAGVFGMFAFQTIVNIGMNLKLLPIVGVTLPFFSAGGSSVAISYASIGIVMSIYIRNHNKLFLNV